MKNTEINQPKILITTLSSSDVAFVLKDQHQDSPHILKILGHYASIVSTFCIIINSADDPSSTLDNQLLKLWETNHPKSTISFSFFREKLDNINDYEKVAIWIDKLFGRIVVNHEIPTLENSPYIVNIQHDSVVIHSVLAFYGKIKLMAINEFFNTNGSTRERLPYAYLSNSGLEEEYLLIDKKIKSALEKVDDKIIFDDSNEINELHKACCFLAQTDLTILIQGESGSGKEHIAHLIHHLRSISSDKKDFPFVAFNCAAIAESLFESELFGHVANAFNGATEKTGLVELADGGVLFLDEVGAMPLSSQSKLLRFIQEKKFYKVGGTEERRSNPFIISATNSELWRGSSVNFRMDLYHRLSEFELSMPPLRNRSKKKDLISIKWQNILRNLPFGNPKLNNIPDGILRIMLEYDWPGNFRELKNVIAKILITIAIRNVDDEDGCLTIAKEVLSPKRSTNSQNTLTPADALFNENVDKLFNAKWKNYSELKDIIADLEFFAHKSKFETLKVPNVKRYEDATGFSRQNFTKYYELVDGKVEKK